MLNETIKSARAAPSERGYTLMELLVVLAIVGILVAVGAPSLQETIRNNAREAAMMDLMSSLALARTQAVNQSTRVSVCRTTDQSTCNPGGDWDSGWLVFSDPPVSGATMGAVDAGSDEILEVHSRLDGVAAITLADSLNYVQFDADGFLRNSGSGAYFKVCGEDNLAAEARAIWVFNTGRASLSIDDGDGVHNDMDGNDLSCP